MTANDSDVSDGDTLTGSQVVRVYGQNLTSPFVTLTFGEVEYTPLAQGEGYIEFILGDNGTATINVDGSPFMSFEIEGITIPSFLPTLIQGFLTANPSFPTTGRASSMTVIANCLNYSRKVTIELPRILIWMPNTPDDIQESDFTFVNATLQDFGVDGNVKTALLIQPINPDEVVQVLYQDFIIVVGNYTTE